MPRAKNTEEYKDTTMKFRLTTEERNHIRVQADLAGISDSEYVRLCAGNKHIIANVDLAMIRELRRIAGLMKHIHNTSVGAYSSQTSAMLNELHSAIKGISLDNKKD
jgi:hypothetical protein